MTARNARRACAAALAGALLAALGLACVPALGAARARFDTRLLAIIPPPGYPALAYVDPNGRIYEGTYENPTGDTVPSRVIEYTNDGYLQRSWTVQGQNLSQGHGVQVAQSDAHGDLILLDKDPARALVLDARTGKQTTYASFPDLPLCPSSRPCSPARQDLPPEPDYAAWGPDGSLYVTDYQQAVIWRVPPHGGTPTVWLADPRLDGNMFGTAGIELAADRHTLLFTQASSAGAGHITLPPGGLLPGGVSLPGGLLSGGTLPGGVNPSTGKLYSVTIGSGDRPGPIRQLWESRPADAPDGLAIARSGHVYIALVGPTNQIVEVGTGGQEIARFPSTPGTGANGSSVPFDSPSSAMFLGSRLIVANQAYLSGNAAHMAILDVETGEPGLVPYIPASAGPLAAAPRPFTCAQPTGRVAGTSLGPMRLGMTRAQVRREFFHISTHRRRYMDYFCSSHSIRVGYPSGRLLRSVPRHDRARLSGRAVLALTSSLHYALRGIRRGERVSRIRHVSLSQRFRVGVNQWYVIANGSSHGILKVRFGVVQEIGVADRLLTRNRSADHLFLRAFGLMSASG